MCGLQIKLLTIDDRLYFKKATEIIKEGQGEESVTDNHIELFTNAKECCSFAAYKGDEIVGVATGGILSEKLP